jgi:predicted kinase
MRHQGKLIFFCGKMAAGKSTLAKKIMQQQEAILLVQDELLATLFPGEIVDIPGFIEYSSRLKESIAPHLCALLAKDLVVVLDFPGNTRRQRAWFRDLIERSGADHELHYIDVSDELCKQQLRQRSQGLPEGAAFTSDAEFDAITQYFDPPSPEENFNIVLHRRD